MNNHTSRCPQTWCSPAKLNLFLHINGRLPNGYHELQTVFQFISLCDKLTFNLRQDSIITLSSELDIPAEDNLVTKAAKALQHAADTSLGCDISLTKQIPMGAGLGGGSSNAATTLVALNTLWDLGWQTESLQALGSKLGADVPVFIFGQSAWAEGIGEQLQPYQLPEPWYVILKPDCHIATNTIFSHKHLTRNTKKMRIRPFETGIGQNDCQPVVTRLYPQVQEAVEWLSQKKPARMTGTGASVFAAFESKANAIAVAQAAPACFEAFAVKACNISPLYTKSCENS